MDIINGIVIHCGKMTGQDAEIYCFEKEDTSFLSTRDFSKFHYRIAVGPVTYHGKRIT